MLVARAPSARGGAWCVYACWEWGCLRVLRAWGRLGLIMLPPYGSRHLHDRTLTHPPTVLPASQPHCALFFSHNRNAQRTYGRPRCTCVAELVLPCSFIAQGASAHQEVDLIAGARWRSGDAGLRHSRSDIRLAHGPEPLISITVFLFLIYFILCLYVRDRPMISIRTGTSCLLCQRTDG